MCPHVSEWQEGSLPATARRAEPLVGEQVMFLAPVTGGAQDWADD